MAPSSLEAESHPPVATEATGAPRTLSRLELLPSELIVEIMKKMRPTELTRLAKSSKRLLAVFQKSIGITLPFVLQRQPELEIILLLCTASRRELQRDRMLHPRAITFDPKASDNGFSPDANKDIVLLEPSIVGDPEFRHIRVNMGFMTHVWNVLKFVDWWADEYPAIRWRDQPEDRRCLRSDEEARVRKAIARWWLYAHYFHMNNHRDVYQPKKWADDKRLHHIRLMSTREICELETLWNAVYDLISHELCSSVQEIDAANGGGVDRVRWGKDEGRHRAIVSTYMKLDPSMIKGFIYEFYGRKKMDIVYATRTLKKDFNLDSESMSSAMTTVLQERMMLKPNGISSPPRSGIVDEDRDEDVDPNVWDKDDAPNGKPPLDPQRIRSFPWENQKRLPYGDDGSEEPR
ncbi:hypothetical protein SLS62_009276 [Diatrype stigma]|uniref:F-box domain-containing protein n=1 Tax=Diatrype stigma TaxID=117547 RepID=A0AAN9YLG5_9PEZI